LPGGGGGGGDQARRPPAITFIATTPMPALLACSISASMLLSMVKLYVNRTTSRAPFLTRNGIMSFALWVLRPAKRIFPCCLAICWASNNSSGTSDVEVVGTELAQAGVKVTQGAILGACPGLAGEDEVLAFLLERRAYHPFVVTM